MAEAKDAIPITERINEAIALGHGGQPEEARARFVELWAQIQPNGNPFHRCIVAHYMADLQDDPRDESTWNLCALAAAEEMTEEDVRAHYPMMSLRALYPSLHLNVADGYQRLGELSKAAAYLIRAQESLDALPDDDYGRMIRSAISRLANRLTEA